MVTLSVGDFDAFIAAAAGRGIEPESRDPDGNEVGVGGPPVDEAPPST